MDEAVEDFLEHYGVPGMRWGKRKARKASQAKTSDTAKTKYQKSPSRLSDAELNKRIKRLDMEKRYNELNSTTQSEGRQMATRILKNVGEQTATRVANQVAYYAVSKAISNVVGEDVAKGVFGKNAPVKKTVSVTSNTPGKKPKTKKKKVKKNP